MALHRQRVRVGTKKDGSPQVKWTQGRSLDELNDNIVRTYVEYELYVHSNNDQIMDAGEKVNELLSS